MYCLWYCVRTYLPEACSASAASWLAVALCSLYQLLADTYHEYGNTLALTRKKMMAQSSVTKLVASSATSCLPIHKAIHPI